MAAFLSFADLGIRPPCLFLGWEHLHCASRNASVHCASALPFTLARWAISIDGSGGKDGAPASWAAIVLANDGHLRLQPYTAFAGLVLGPQQSQSVGGVSCTSTTAEGTALAWTLLWIIAKSRGLAVLIVYDATVGIDVAQGHYSWHAEAKLSFVLFCVPSPSSRPRTLLLASSMRLLIRAILGMNWRR